MNILQKKRRMCVMNNEKEELEETKTENKKNRSVLVK